MTFTERLQTLEDPRHPINIRHDFFDILFLTVSAILSQAEGWEDIEEFGKNKGIFSVVFANKIRF